MGEILLYLLIYVVGGLSGVGLMACIQAGKLTDNQDKNF